MEWAERGRETALDLVELLSPSAMAMHGDLSALTLAQGKAARVLSELTMAVEAARSEERGRMAAGMGQRRLRGLRWS